MRALAWLAIVCAVVLGREIGDERLSAVAAPLVVLALWFGAPAVLRGAILLVAAAIVAAWLLGGPNAVINVLPSLIAGLIGWLFARSLLRGRQPLIARAISAMDGVVPLNDPAVARYALRLTRLWAVFQFVLALFGLLCVIGLRDAAGLYLPSPRAFGMLILPLAVIALFLLEFALRTHLLPQAPRRSLFVFVRDLVRIWPNLIER